MNTQIKKVLYINDNIADVALFEEAIEIKNLAIELMHVSDGEELLSYIRKCKLDSSEILPDLIITNLDVPKFQGHKIINVLKDDKMLSHIPLIIFCSSNLKSDIIKAYEHGANAYIYKPLNVDEIFETIELIDKFWLRTCVAAQVNLASRHEFN